MALQELADSIDAHGLIQPLVVRLVPEDPSSWTLVCGERRLRAIRDHLLPLGGTLRFAGELLPEGCLPAVSMGELDPLAAEEAELEENIRRADLTWAEEAAATARLSALRAKQSALMGDTPPTAADLARELMPEETRGKSDGELGDYQAKVRRQLIVAKHLGNPEVAGAKSLKEAWKALKRADSAERNVELARTVGKTFSFASHSITNADSLEWMRGYMADSFDVILTDPPYGMGADEFGDSGGTTAGSHNYKDNYEYWLTIIQTLSVESFRIAKPQAHLYCFVDIDNFSEARDLFKEAGWWVHRTPLIWYKPAAPRIPWPDFGPQRKWEMILYANKGKRPVTRIAPDVITCNPDENLGHMAQKPVMLFVDLLKRTVRPGDTALDPFAGTGTLLAAAHELQVRATVIEQDESSYGLCLKRLDQLKEKK